MIHFAGSNTIKDAWYLDYPSARIQIQFSSNRCTEIGDKMKILYQHHRGGIMHFPCFHNLDAMASNRGMAE
jgi:hypothetical protein